MPGEELGWVEKYWIMKMELIDSVYIFYKCIGTVSYATLYHVESMYYCIVYYRMFGSKHLHITDLVQKNLQYSAT